MRILDGRHMVYEQNEQRVQRPTNPVEGGSPPTYTLPLDKACLNQACGLGHPTTYQGYRHLPRCKRYAGASDCLMGAEKSACIKRTVYPYA